MRLFFNPLVLSVVMGISIPVHASPSIAIIHERSPYGDQIHFEKNGAIFSFDLARGLTISVERHFLQIVQVGDDKQGEMVLRTLDSGIKVPYTLGPNGPVFGMEGDMFIEDFYANPPSSERTNMESLKSFTGEWAKEQISKRQQAAWGCDDWTAWTIGAFVACPASAGLGCLAGAYGLFRQMRAC